MRRSSRVLARAWEAIGLSDPPPGLASGFRLGAGRCDQHNSAMRIAPLSLAAAVASVLLLATEPLADADQKDARLPALFDALKAAQTVEAARPVEMQIWSIWTDSDNAEVNRLMAEGISAMNVADAKTALKDFTRVVEIAPDFAEGWNKRATLFYLLGQFDASMADIDRTLELEPRHFGALSGLGLIQMTLEHDEQAVDAFERALSIHPQMTGPRVNIEVLKERIKSKSI
jgi:tetratricopeptide (TPR) repeat protein